MAGFFLLKIIVTLTDMLKAKDGDFSYF